MQCQKTEGDEFCYELEIFVWISDAFCAAHHLLLWETNRIIKNFRFQIELVPRSCHCLLAISYGRRQVPSRGVFIVKRCYNHWKPLSRSFAARITFLSGSTGLCMPRFASQQSHLLLFFPLFPHRFWDTPSVLSYECRKLKVRGLMCRRTEYVGPHFRVTGLKYKSNLPPSLRVPLWRDPTKRKGSRQYKVC